jgi:hypothetical protein
MRKLTILSSLILCLLLSTLPDRSFSRMRPPQTPAQQQRWMQEQQQKAEQMRLKMEQDRLQVEERQKAAQQEARKIWEEYSDSEAWPQALGVTPEQWKAIKPKLDRIRQLRSMPGINVSVYAFGGGGTNHSDSFSHSSGGGGGAGTGSSFAGGGARGAGGVSSGGGYVFRGAAGGTAGARGTVGGSGAQGGPFVSSGAASAGSGYGFAIGGTGPVKKKVGEVNLGWQWRRPSLNEEPDRLTEGDKACEQLLDALETKNPDAAQVRQRLEALRKIREQRRTELRETQRQLRELITPEQEPKLVLMGYLD